MAEYPARARRVVAENGRYVTERRPTQHPEAGRDGVATWIAAGTSLAAWCYLATMRLLHSIGILALASCGGRVVIDAAGTGSPSSTTVTGSGGAATASTTATMSGAGGCGGDCNPPPACTPPLVPCNGVCMDVSADPANCGACGHDCLGGACAAGMCQPIVLSTTDAAFDLTVDATHVYWVTHPGDVWKVPLTGGDAVELFHQPPSYSNGESAIAVHGESVYWVSAADVAVRSIPKAGGEVVVLASDPGILWTIAANDTGVYWGYINDQPRIMRLPPGATSPVLVAKPLNPSKLALDDSYVYFGDMSLSKLMRAPIAGGPPIELAKYVPNRQVTVDATFIYWTSGPLDGVMLGWGRVFRMPLTGGAPEVLVKNLDWPSGIVTDSANIYFTDMQSGKIIRVPIGGGEAVVLAEQQDAPWAIAQDAQSIYWTTGQSVVKLAK